MESREAQDTRLCGAHNQAVGIARPLRWHTELHEAAEHNSRALNASLDIHRTWTQTKHRPRLTDRATDSATAAACYRCGGRHPANDWRFRTSGAIITQYGSTVYIYRDCYSLSAFKAILKENSDLTFNFKLFPFLPT